MSVTVDVNVLARGSGVPDAHLAALMRQHGVRVLYTRDRDCRRFEDIELRDPTTWRAPAAVPRDIWDRPRQPGR